MAIFVPRFLRQLRDVDTSGGAVGDALVLDGDGETWVPAAGGGAGGGAPIGATYITQTPDGDLSAEQALSALATGLVKNTTGTGVLSIAVPGTDYPSQAAFDDHSARHENGGADEISVAGLSGLLADAQTSLAHNHAGEDITSGTVADARIASTIARDSEVTSAIATALAAADGAGLADDGAGVLSVNVDGATIEINADALRVKAGGIGANEIGVNAVGSSELADDAVDTAAIQNGAVTAAKVAADVATQAELDAHTGDTSDAHDASAISADSTTLVGTGTDVQAVLEELDNGISDHLADSSAAHAASAISASSATLSGTGTDVQAVFEELDNLLDDHSARHEEGGADVLAITAGIVDSEAATDGQILTADGSGVAAWEDAPAGGAVAAEDVSVADAGGDFTATDVEGVLAELQADHEADATGLSDHIADASAAHAASAISASSATLSGTGTDVQAVFEELDNLLDDHSARHENGGADEISVAGLSGLLTDGQTPLAHAASHQDGGADEISIADLAGTSVELAAHLADSSDAHDASAISIADAGSDFTATTVEGALDELQADHEADATALSDHISDASAAHAASAISVNSATLVGTGTDVQAVFEELDNGIADHLADTTDAHAGTAITNTPAGNIAATTTQAAINELDSEKTTAAAALAAALTEIADQKRVVEIGVTDPNGDAITTGDGKAHLFIPTLLNGHNLVAAHAGVTTVSSSGLPTFQIHNVTQAADMLSTKITIDASEKTSYSAAAAPVIDASNDDVATGDELRVDIDVAGTGAKGLCVLLTFEAP